MFDPLEPELPQTVTFTFNGQSVTCAPGHTVASALLAANITSFRATPVSGAPRAPFCMMGACYDCLVSINGATLQACMIPATHGLVIQKAHQSQQGEPKEVTT